MFAEMRAQSRQTSAHNKNWQEMEPAIVAARLPDAEEDIKRRMPRSKAAISRLDHMDMGRVRSVHQKPSMEILMPD